MTKNKKTKRSEIIGVMVLVISLCVAIQSALITIFITGEPTELIEWFRVVFLFITLLSFTTMEIGCALIKE